MSLNTPSWKILTPIQRMTRSSMYHRKHGLCQHCGHSNKDHVPLDNRSFPKRIGPAYGPKWPGQGCQLECIACGCWALIIPCEEEYR